MQTIKDIATWTITLFIGVTACVAAYMGVRYVVNLVLSSSL